MKRSIVLLYVILTICFVFSPSNMLAAQTATPYLYAYVQQAENGSIVIRGIDPTNPSSTTDGLSVNTINRSVVQDVAVSPNGEWLALVLDSHTTKSLRLVNTITSEVRDIAVNLPLIDAANTFGPLQNVTWSPDSRYLALIGVQNDVSDAYLYTVQNNTIANLTADALGQYRLAWLHDSSRLAVLTENCSAADSCTLSVDIVEIPTKIRQPAITIAQYEFRPYGSQTCRFQWSPGGQFISFMKECYKSGVVEPKELYILNVGKKLVSKLTNFASQSNVPSGSGEILLFADYETLWYDSQTLLVGTRYLADNINNIKATQTLSYQLPSGTSTVLNSSMTRDWAVNPASGELAFLTSTFNDSSQAQNPAVQIAMFNGGSLNVSKSAPDGCNLSWSPNGSFLGYANRGRPLEYCTDPIRGFTFVNKANGQVQEHTLLVDQRSNRVRIAGWIRNKAVPMVTPTPTSTPARMLTPGG